MSDKSELKKLASIVGGWENLASHLWEHMDARSKTRTKKRLTPKIVATPSPFFAHSDKKKAGRPLKYDHFGTLAILVVLREMKRLTIGGERGIDRIKNLICYINDPKSNPIRGLPSRLRPLLAEPDVVNAVPRLSTDMNFGNGRTKVPDVVNSYRKYLSEFKRTHKHFLKAMESRPLDSPLSANLDPEHLSD